MLSYPITQREDVQDLLHGTLIADPYRWLEDLDGEATRHWIDEQNTLTNSFLKDIPERDQIRQRLEALWDYDKFGLPQRRGERYFMQQQNGLQNQPVLYWLDELDAEPQVLLDPNEISAEGTTALSGYTISDDGEYLAYGLSRGGSDWMEWRVRHVESGEDLPDELRWIKFSSAAWLPDGSGFFYSRYDEPGEGEELSGANYNQKLCFHQLNSDQGSDEVVYARPDHKEWGFHSTVTRDGRYLVITVWKGTHRLDSIFYQDLASGGPMIELLPDFEAAYVFLGNRGSIFYFRTDLDAPNSRLIAIDVEEPGREKWREIIPEEEDILEMVKLVGGRFVAVYLHHAYHQLRIYDLDGKLLNRVELPTMGSVSGLSGRDEDRELFFGFTTFITPQSVYRMDVEEGEPVLFRQTDVPFDPADYVTEQHFFQSKDGTRIPCFLIRRSDVEPGPETPLYQYGYGGFQISLTPQFRIGWLVWLEMGGVIVQVNLRGGGEYGRRWHDAGKLTNKQNVFDDFIAASEWLIESGRAARERLAIGGGSNGGLLVGACMVQRPDLFGACVPGVGVLDMLRFHKFTIGWAWTSDYGSPDESEDFQTLLAYSPYHNIEPGVAYPPTLITTGDHDDRVFPAHSFKFAAALQHAQSGPAPILIRVATQAGHGAGKPTHMIIDEIADVWAFLHRILGGTSQPQGGRQ